MALLDYSEKIAPLFLKLSHNSLRAHDHRCEYPDKNHIYAFCGTEKGLLILNVSDIKNPTETASLNIGKVSSIAFYKSDNDSETYAALANGEDGLIIINISDPFNPNEIGSCATFYYAQGVWVDSTFAYIAEGIYGTGCLRIINISNLTSPLEVSHFSTQYPRDVQIRGNYAYLAVESRGLRIVDISNPSIPVLVGQYGGPSMMSRAEIGEQGNVNVQHVVPSNILSHLSDGFQKGLSFNITHGAAYLDKNHISLRFLG